MHLLSKTGTNPSSMTMLKPGKITRKEMSKLFSCDYLIRQIHKNIFVWILKRYMDPFNWKKWRILITVRNPQGVYQAKYCYGSVIKANSHSVDIFRLIKNQCRRRSRRKIGSTPPSTNTQKITQKLPKKVVPWRKSFFRMSNVKMKVSIIVTIN